MTDEELLAFVHGVRVQRNAIGLSQQGLSRRAGLSTTALGNIETVPGRYSALRSPDVRHALVKALGVAQSVLIELGRQYIRDNGCIPCRRWGINTQSCIQHDPQPDGRHRQDPKL